jgi:hypothetical protein
VTFADSVLHLVRAGARIDSWAGPDVFVPSEAPAAALSEPAAEAPSLSEASAAGSRTSDEAQFLEIELAAEAGQDVDQYHPGLADLEAAVGLVSAGLATRVVLAGFPSWPGLLWHAYRLADTTDVLILPTVVRPGGKVDIVITREHAADG